MIQLRLIFVFFLMFFYSCKSDKYHSIEGPQIVAGTSKVSGRIISPNNQNKDSIKVFIMVPHPISGEFSKYEVHTDILGNFSLDVDVEMDTSLIGLYSSVNPYKSLRLNLINGGITHVDVSYNKVDEFKNVDAKPIMNKYDMMQGMDVLYNMIKYRLDGPPTSLYDKSIDEVMNHLKISRLKKLEKFVYSDNLLSKEFKDILSLEYLLFSSTPELFDYERGMLLNYRNVTRDTVGTPKILKIDGSYFQFLKDFDLNNPQYLHTATFPEFQLEILRNEVLGLPAIGDKAIETWLLEVKGILSDLIGFDKGPYYDILVANAYSRQLNEEVKPLSEKQKENITKYWDNGEIAKILLRKNEKVIALESEKSALVVRDISDVSKEQVLETILSKHKGKVVFIDFWATWCGPCLDAMKQFKAVKGNFKKDDIVYVYLTNGSSPKKLWEEKIKGIGGEHYYLTGEQWAYLMDQHGFEYIPSYLLFDKSGELADKFVSYPGNDKMIEVINEVVK